MLGTTPRRNAATASPTTSARRRGLLAELVAWLGAATLAESIVSAVLARGERNP
jgi:hypothetical protein